MDEPTEGQIPEVKEPRVYDEAHVKGLNAEAAKYRVERNELRKTVEDLTAKVKTHEEEGKSEVEKLASKVAEYEAKLAEKDREITEGAKRSRIMAEASKLNVVDPDAVYRLLDLSTVEDPADVKKAITALLKEKPYLVKAPALPTPGTGGPPVVGKKSPDQMFTEMLKGGAK